MTTSIIKLDDVISMTTLEIAELTGKRHGNVMRDCEKLLEVSRLKNELAEIVYSDAQAKDRKAYQLTKKATFVLVSGYSAELRLKCFEHIEALEAQVQRLEDDKKRVAIQSANRRGVTWGDFCKANNLPAQRLMTALKKSGSLFRFKPNGRVEVNPSYAEFFTLLKPTDRRFNPSGINFRFNAKGVERFSRQKAIDQFRYELVVQLGSDDEKRLMILSRKQSAAL